MYTKEPAKKQYSFNTDWFMVSDVNKSHEIIRIADSLDWISSTERLAQFYYPDNGHPTKPARDRI